MFRGVGYGWSGVGKLWILGIGDAWRCEGARTLRARAPKRGAVAVVFVAAREQGREGKARPCVAESRSGEGVTGTRWGRRGRDLFGQVGDRLEGGNGAIENRPQAAGLCEAFFVSGDVEAPEQGDGVLMVFDRQSID